MPDYSMKDYHRELLEAKRVHTLTLKRWAKLKVELLSDDPQEKQSAFRRLTKRLEKAEHRLNEAVAAFPKKAKNPNQKENGMVKKSKKNKKKAKAQAAAEAPEVDETEEEEEVEETEEEEEEVEEEEAADDEDEEEPDEEEEEEEPPKKAKKGKAKEKKAKKPKGPGVIASIVEFIENSKKGITKDQLLEKLVKRFPDRKADSMKNTINVQIPNRLRKDKGITVLRDDKGRYSVK